MSGWIEAMADAVDAHEAAQAPPRSKASGPPSMPAPTEPATTPRVSEVPVQRWAHELQLATLEYGPREEPERFASRYILNDGTMTQEAHDALLRKAAQAFNNRDVDWEIEAAIQREKEAHERSIKEWEARIAAQPLSDHQAIPRGPPPAGTSSMRALPLTKNLQGLVFQCSLHHQRHHLQMQLKD